MTSATNAPLSSAYEPQVKRPHMPRPDRDDARDGAQYVAAIRKHLPLVLGLPLVVGVIVMGLSLRRNREYDARAAFLPSEPSSPSAAIGSLSSVATQLGIPGLSTVAANSAALGPQFYGDLLTSNAVLHALVTTHFDAPTSENGGPAFSGTLVEYLQGNGKTAADREIDAMNHVRSGRLTVAVDRPTGVVRFQVHTNNRRLSELVARRILDLVNDFNLRRRQTQAGNEREFARRRAAATLDTLHAAEAALAEFRATNIDFSRSPRLATRETELQRRVAFAQTMYTTVAQRYELANLEAIRNTPVITIIDTPEGLVEGMPRHTAAFSIAAFFMMLVACAAWAVWVEGRRLAATSGHV